MLSPFRSTTRWCFTSSLDTRRSHNGRTGAAQASLTCTRSGLRCVLRCRQTCPRTARSLCTTTAETVDVKKQKRANRQTSFRHPDASSSAPTYRSLGSRLPSTSVRNIVPSDAESATQVTATLVLSEGSPRLYAPTGPHQPHILKTASKVCFTAAATLEVSCTYRSKCLNTRCSNDPTEWALKSEDTNAICKAGMVKICPCLTYPCTP